MNFIVNILYYVVPFLVLLGILVFVHEFGHYLVAKLCKVKVSEFSIGFGKQLWGKMDKAGTLWKVSAIPLGGYCKFLGDEDAASSSGKNSNLSEEDKKYAFAILQSIRNFFCSEMSISYRHEWYFLFLFFVNYT